ncbi:oligopeptide/dipeptide ABC transporter ATP-binding protein [Rhodophyticola sp.]|uniref:oligopeptide/dipeptide ABC transporter ATP-binding protein n=1 Tax=Rhodophyticola sp. TaxID=2680032 RepID=UPI003D28809A
MLLDSIPISKPSDRKVCKRRDVGNIPSLANRPEGCAFLTRCPHARDLCHRLSPKPDTGARRPGVDGMSLHGRDYRRKWRTARTLRKPNEAA